MTQTFPAALPVYSNPTASMSLGSADHVSLHEDINDDVSLGIAPKIGSQGSDATLQTPTANDLLVGVSPNGASKWKKAVNANLLVPVYSTTGAVTTAGSDIDLTKLVSGSLSHSPVTNGDMRWAQRGTTITSPVNGQYLLDRFRYETAGTAGTVTVTRTAQGSPLVTGGPFIPYSLLATVTSADAAVAAGDLVCIGQRIEGSNFAPYMQRQITVGFFVLSSIIGTHTVSLTNSSQDRSCVMEYTISTANVFEWKQVTFPASPSAGGWNTATGVGAQLSWALMCGSTYQTTAGAWQTGNFRGTAAQVNVMGTGSATFRITGVQVRVGPVAPYTRDRPDSIELLFCQRYFWKNYPADTVRGSGIATAYITYTVPGGTVASNEYYIRDQFPVPMVSVPTPTLFGYANNATQSSNGSGTDYGANSAVAATVTQSMVAVQNQLAASGTLLVSANRLIFLGMEMAAEL